MSEEALNDADELLHRQVHPDFLVKGRVGSQAFRPMPKDEGQLSVSRGSLTSAADACLLFTRKRGLSSAGVWSVTVGECSRVDLKAFSDPLTEPVDDPAHARVDFGEVSSSAAVKLSKRMAAFARTRGPQHPADDRDEA